MNTSLGGDWNVRGILGNSLRAGLFVIIIALLAHIHIPFPFLPSTLISLQSIGVVLAGILLGPIWGTAAAIVVLLAAVGGLPVLHGGTGVEFLLAGPKAGYFLSYPMAVAAIGYTIHRGVELRAVQTIGVKQLLGAIILGMLVTNLGLVVGYMITEGTGVVDALLLTTIQFVPLEMLKIGVVIGIVRIDLLVAS